MTSYSTGTISVGAGSTSVTGVGTNWLTSGVRAGDQLIAAGLTAYIQSVNSATSITLRRPWPGGALSGANYDIDLIDDGVRSLVAANSLLQALGAGTLTSLGALAGAANQMPYWTGAGVMAPTGLTAEARNLLASTLLSRSGDNLVTTTAARLTGGVVTQSDIDTTAGRLTKVGDFGLGASSAPLVTLNAAVTQGLYRYAGSDPNSPAAGSPGMVLVMAISATNIVQIARRANNWTMFTRWSGDNGATWQPWSQFFGQRSVLGTVSQSGGIPTGAVIERGSNANGEFVRFADGTQFCFHAVSCSTSAGVTWTFPAAFISAPRPAGLTEGSVLTGIVLDSAPTATAMVISIRDTANARQSGFARVQAVGRWF